MTAFEPKTTMKFTITATPQRDAQKKTLHRLIRMQREIQNALDKIADRRAKTDNQKKQRGGRIWTSRARMSQISRVEPGATFTLVVTPQIVPDLKSVEKYLKAEKVAKAK